MYTYLQVGDPGVTLASITVAIRRRGGGGQIIGRDAPGVPICPINTVCLDMQVHGINAYVGITLEYLLVAPVWHERVQAADLIIISNVEHLSLGWRST